MSELNQQIQILSERLDNLLKNQDNSMREILQLKEDIRLLKLKVNSFDSNQVVETKIELPPVKETIRQTIPLQNNNWEGQKSIANPNIKPAGEFKPTPNKQQSNLSLEKFIGENLISKIGIIITVIGVAIGAKYSIEHHLISPLTRIILGYLIGVGLLLTGIKLKLKYETYSAVLVSGAMAIFYFITYAAYAFYGLMPQVMAFAIMVVFTAFTVFAALKYNQQIIAHIGLVGAYAVPFLLSEGKGQVAILFTYTAIINIGILSVAIKKYWKSLYYAAFGITWMLYSTWLFSNAVLDSHRTTAFLFLVIFFLLFYAVFLVYKLIQKEHYDVGDVIMIFFNSFIFYGAGYYIIGYQAIDAEYLGLFTLANAIIHFIVARIIYVQKLADKNLFYLIAGLVLVFITITIPVQLNGNWVTLLWATEAALLFWVGRTKVVIVYEKLSLILIVLAFLSLGHDWLINYHLLDPHHIKIWIPLFNVNFLSALIVMGAYVFMRKINLSNRIETSISNQNTIPNLLDYLLPILIIFILFISLKLELAHYFKQLYFASEIVIKHTEENYSESIYNQDIRLFESVWSINYSLVFFAILGLLNIVKFKSRELLVVNLILQLFLMVVFLTQGLHVLNELRSYYDLIGHSQYYKTNGSYIWIRYISFLCIGLSLYSLYKSSRTSLLNTGLKMPYDIVLYLSILWILSNELMNLMEGIRNNQSNKLSLSIFWGAYALFLISLGIWKKKIHLRIFAITLFSVTLLKLFFYDIAHLNTISKTIVFVSLGILLLIISFLYHKFKTFISDEN